jgi:hypothetical protein
MVWIFLIVLFTAVVGSVAFTATLGFYVEFFWVGLINVAISISIFISVIQHL